MDVGKILARSSVERNKVVKESVSDITPMKPQKKSSSEDIESFENEGGAVSLENVEEIKKEATVSITVPVYIDEHPLYQRYNGLWLKVRELRNKKGKDYGTPEDPFANIRGAEEFGVKAWIGAANSANDCLTRIKQYAKTGTLENESVRDSMLDLANYALIALTLWEEENEKS